MRGGMWADAGWRFTRCLSRSRRIPQTQPEPSARRYLRLPLVSGTTPMLKYQWNGAEISCFQSSQRETVQTNSSKGAFRKQTQQSPIPANACWGTTSSLCIRYGTNTAIKFSCSKSWISRDRAANFRNKTLLFTGFLKKFTASLSRAFSVSFNGAEPGNYGKKDKTDKIKCLCLWTLSMHKQFQRQNLK